jgi:phage terminase large subunit-like protein
MDDRLEKALEHANYNASLALRRENLRLKFENQTLYAANGGLFRVDYALIATVSEFVRSEYEDAILIDQKQKPVKIDNLTAFLDAITSIYHEASQEYYSDYEMLRKARKVKAVAGL